MLNDDDLEFLEGCPLCGGDALASVYSRPDEHLPTLNLDRCDTCDIVFLNPRLQLHAIENLENSSRTYQYDGDKVERSVQALDRLLQDLEAYGRDRGRFLDVGCNRGFLVESARRRGWSAVGIDLSSAAVDDARSLFEGIDVRQGEVASLPTKDSFDLITCWHVLEHTLSPEAFLKDISRRLTHGGVLAIQVPSYTFLQQFIESDRELSLVCSVHNFYFTERTLTTLLARNDLEIVMALDNGDDFMLTVVARRPARSRRRWLASKVRRLKAAQRPAQLAASAGDTHVSGPAGT